MKKTAVRDLITLFGSASTLAAHAKIDSATVTRWEKPYEWKGGGHRGNGGRVPTRYNRAIMAGAGEFIAEFPPEQRVKFIAAVSACLDPAVCPTCGSPVDDGRVL